MWEECTLTQHRLCLNDPFLSYCFVFRFLPWKAALHPSGLEMEVRGQDLGAPSMYHLSSVEEEGTWLMCTGVILWRLQATQAELKRTVSALPLAWHCPWA